MANKRDSGLLHSLTGIDSYKNLINQLLVGNSLEGFVVEQICNMLGDAYKYYFYRTHQGAGCDLLLVKAGRVEYAIEIKNTLSPKISKGFRISMEDTEAEKGIIICRLQESYPRDKLIDAMGLEQFIEILQINR